MVRLRLLTHLVNTGERGVRAAAGGHFELRPTSWVGPVNRYFPSSFFIF